MKASFKFELRKDREDKDGRRVLGLRYTAKRKMTLISLNLSLYPSEWNEKKNVVKSTVLNSVAINKIIHTTYKAGLDLILEYYFFPLSPKEFRKKLLAPSKQKSESSQDSFYEFCLVQLKLEKSFKGEGTIDNYKKLINTMKVWKPELTFDEIDEDFIKKFHQHEKEVGNKDSTIAKKHANLKYLIGLAIDKEKNKKSPYKKIKIKKVHKAENQDVLTEEELKILHQIYLSKKYKARKQEVLREFLFSCYSGLSYGEFEQLSYSDIKLVKMKDGSLIPLLTNDRIKTDVTYKIPIVSSTVLELVGNGEEVEKIFHPLTNQPTNRYLKVIMKEVGIKKKMTFHMSRHTFRTIAARRGINDTMAERMMGHSEGDDIKNIYTHLADEDLIQEMLNKWVVE